MDKDMLLALDTLAQEVAVKKQTIPHSEVGLDLFASGTIRKEVGAGCKYRSLVYLNRVEGWQKP